MQVNEIQDVTTAELCENIENEFFAKTFEELFQLRVDCNYLTRYRFALISETISANLYLVK